METADVEVLQTQLKFTLWFIGVLMTALSFFVIKAFNAQAKKDESQDAQLIDFSKIVTKLSDAIASIDKATAINTKINEQHEKHLAKHDLILENLLSTTKTKR